MKATLATHLNLTMMEMLRFRPPDRLVIERTENSHRMSRKSTDNLSKFSNESHILFQRSEQSHLQQLQRVLKTLERIMEDQAAEDVGLTPIKKPILDADESDSEQPAPKRTEVAQVEPLPIVAKGNDSDDDDEPVTGRTSIASQTAIPTVTKDDESEDWSNDDSGRA